MVWIKYIYTDGSSLCCTQLWPKVVRYTKKWLGPNYRKKIITFTDKYHYFVLTPESVRTVRDLPPIQLYIIMPLKHSMSRNACNGNSRQKSPDGWGKFKWGSKKCSLQSGEGDGNDESWFIHLGSWKGQTLLYWMLKYNNKLLDPTSLAWTSIENRTT